MTAETNSLALGAEVEELSLPDVPARSPWKNLHPLIPALVLGFAGLLLTSASLLWRIWTNDALRSIGIYFPLVSIILILRVWRRQHWEMRGSWWGILPLYYAVIMARDGGNAFQMVVLGKNMGFTLLPLGLTVFAYGSGIVLLLGGTRVWRAALFPLALLLFVNPVPAAFQLADLPLQFFCARVAQSFAAMIGVHPDVNQLRLMFAPGFGMFIAPGCDGIRGAVALGYLSLILGYLYRFSIRARVLLTIAAVALGYLFNLIRLCCLILFYRAALSFPSLQPHGTGADYLIGGVLFLIVAALFARVMLWKMPEKLSASSRELEATENGPHRSAFYWKSSTASLLVLVSLFSSVRALAAITGEKMPRAGSEPVSQNIFPQQIGNYQMQRTWSEQDWLGGLAYRWAAYSQESSGNEIDVALWLGPGVHYPIACHFSKGERPAWQQVSTLPTAQGGSATFALDFYENPPGDQTLEATTVCEAGGCKENELGLLPSQKTVTIASMGWNNLLFHPTSTPVPVIIRTQSLDRTGTSAEAKDRMLHDVQDFISGLNTHALVQFAQSRNQ